MEWSTPFRWAPAVGLVLIALAGAGHRSDISTAPFPDEASVASDTLAWEIPWFPDPPRPVSVPTPPDTTEAVWPVTIEELPSDVPGPADPVEWLTAEEASALFDGPAPGAGYDPPSADSGEPQPQAAPGAPSREPLQVVAVIPAGEIAEAADLTVIFSSPMVPLGQADAPDPPVELAPQPEGEWQWLDPRTLRFQPTGGRLPGGTRYTIDVPEGTTGASGSRLESAHRTVLELRGPRALGGAPNLGITERRPVIILQMDQDTDPAVVAAASRLEFSGRTIALEPAELADVTDARMRAAERVTGGHPVAIRPVEALPSEADVTFRLSADLVSREGPIATGRAQTLRFRTLGPLLLTNVPCTREASPCEARGPLRLTFSTPLDPEQPLEDRVRVDPEPEGMQIHPSAQGLWIRGDFRPFTSYDLEVDGTLVDVFGQELGESRHEVVHFGAASPYLNLTGPPLVGIPVTAPAEIELTTRGIRAVEVRHYRADPTDWGAFQQQQINSDRIRVEPPPDSALVSIDTLHIDDGERRAALLSAPVGEALELAGGHLVVLAREIDPADEADPLDSDWLRAATSRIIWVQRTPVGVEVVRGSTRAYVTVTTFEGEPVPDAALRFDSDSVEVHTDAEGIAAVPLPDSVPASLLVRHRDQVTIVRVGDGRLGIGPPAWARDAGHPRPVWHAVSDRLLYRPGDEIRIQGWLREVRDARMGLPERTREVRFRIESRTGLSGTRVLAEGQGELTAAGGFHFAAELPPDTPSGQTTIRLQALEDAARAIEGWETQTHFRTEEFRRPEYEITLDVSNRDLLPSEDFEAVITARYFDGPAVPGAGIEWGLESLPIVVSPPGWPGWSFGARPEGARPQIVSRLESRTDSGGRHGLRVAPGAFPEPSALALTLRAVIRDLDRQAIARQDRIVVHPASVMPGLRATPALPIRGDTVTIQLAVTDLDGVPGTPAGPPEVRILPPEGSEGPRCELRSTELESPEGESFGGWSCRVVLGDVGQYRIRAEIEDDLGRRSRSERTVSVRGLRVRSFPLIGPSVRPMSRLELGADSEEYAPGDTARVRIRAPFPDGRGLAVHQHHEVRTTVRLALEGSEHEIRIPLGTSPGQHAISIQLSAPGRGRSASGTLPLRVVDPDQALTVEVIPPDRTMAPGDTVAIQALVLDTAGHPVEGAEVAIWLVDEAILSLGGSFGADALLAAFSGAGYPWASERHASLFAQLRWPREPMGAGVLSGRILEGASGQPTRTVLRVIQDNRETSGPTGGDGEFAIEEVPSGPVWIDVVHLGDTIPLGEFEVGAEGLDIGTRILPVRPRAAPSTAVGDSDPEAALRPSPGRAPGSPEGGLRLREVRVGRSISHPPPQEPDRTILRQYFSPLAGFEPAVITGPDGVAEARFVLPHTLTRYRIHARAVHGTHRAGGSDTTMVVDQELVVRTTPPRFLRVGDEAEITLNVQNAGTRPHTVEVALRSDALHLLDAPGARFRLPAGARRTIGIPVRVDGVGPATFEVRSGGNGVADALAMTIQVQAPLAYRSMAFREELGVPGGASVPIQLPAGTRPDAGGLELRVSGSRLGIFEPEIRGLVESPFAWSGLRTGRIRLAAELSDPGPLADAVPPDLVERLVEAALDDVGYFGSTLVQYARGTASLEWVGGRLAGIPSLEPAIELVGAVIALETAGVELPWGLAHALRARFAGEAERFGAVRAASALSAADRVRLESLVRLAEALGREGLPHTYAVGDLDGLLEDLSPATLARLAALGIGGPDQDFLAALQSRASLTAGSVTFRSGRGAHSETGTTERTLAPSSPTEDAAVLEALLLVSPDHELVGGLVRGLSARPSATGRFTDSSLPGILVALSRYARVHEAGVPDAVIRATVSGQTVLDHPVRSRRADDRSVRVPMSQLTTGVSGLETDLVLDHAGDGVVHARALLEWSPADPFQPPESRGFVVRRWFEAVDDDEDVRQEPDGSWTIRAGSRVRVQTEILAPARRSDVLLAVPVPAGLELINPALESPALLFDPNDARGLLSVSPGIGGYHAFGWVRERRILPDAIEAWGPWVHAGSHRMQALAIATIPGEFVAPAPVVREAENPDVYGRGEAVRVRVVVR